MPRTQGLDRQIIAIAWPAIVSNITTPLLGLVDTAIAGHLASASDLAAIALGSTVFNLVYWLFGFLRMGTAGLTAQAFGSDDFHGQAVVLRRALFLSLLIAAGLIVLSPWIGDYALWILDADDVVSPLASRYFSILIWGAPAMLATFSLNGWLIGMQNTKLPMTIAILTNIVNIAASATLVFVCGMKIEGIALGTLISQWTAAVVCVLCVRKIYNPLHVPFKELVKGFGRMMSINTDIFLRTLCMVAVTAWFTRAGASQGVDVLAANALLMQLFLLFSYFSDGFAYAGEALAGKLYGSGDVASMRRLVVRLLKWGGIIALLFTIVYFFFGEWILMLLTDHKEVVDTAREYLPWAVGVPFCGSVAFIYDGIFVGLTLTRRMLFSVAGGMIVFFSIYFSLRVSMGNHALWLSFLSYLVIRAIILHISLSQKNRHFSVR